MSFWEKKNNRSKGRHPQYGWERLEDRVLLTVNVEVSPFDHQQTFLGAGSGYGLYAGHVVNGVPAAQRDEVIDWLFEDLNAPFFRGFNFRGEEGGNDNSDPLDLDISAMNIPAQDVQFALYQEALQRNPNIEVISYTASVPPHIADVDGHHDITKPNFYLEHAEWLYANLVNLKTRYGIETTILDIFNEPDLGKISQQEAALILENTIPALQNLVDSNFATYGIEMPRISGASNLTVSSASNWLTDWEANDPATWDNLDILTTHPYGGGGSGFVQSNYEAIAELKDADHPLFVQNEFEFGHPSFVNNSNALPADLADDDLEAALAQSRILAMAVEAGADAFHIFQGANPSSRAGSSLVHTPWGQTAVRRTGYYTFRQLTSLQPEGSDVVTDVTLGAPEGFHTLAFNKWEDNRVYVNVVNASPTAQETTNLTFRDNDGALIPLLRVTDYVTDATRNLQEIEDVAFSIPTTQWSTTVEPNSVRTFVVELAATGYSIPVGDLTYVRENSNSNLNSTPQDGDMNPRHEFLVGYNGNGTAGSQLGLMRAFMEFDIAAAGIPATDLISAVQLELRGYRGSLGASDAIQFDLFELNDDFVEATATWLDPDGDGNSATGVTTPGGNLGNFLSSSSPYFGSASDYSANGSSEIFHERVVLSNGSTFGQQVDAARNGDFRVALSPGVARTTPNDFFGFFDEETDYAPELIVSARQTDLTGPSVSTAEFRHETDKRVAFTFSEDIDISTLSSSDFQVTNLTTGVVLDSNSVTLSNVTPTSAEIVIRSSLFDDGDWQVILTGGSMQDLAGIGNLEYTFDFFKLDGDFNRDRSVNAADYSVWRDTLGSTSDLRANADNSGLSTNVIDQADYNIWVGNYGSSLAALPAMIVTPEVIEEPAFAEAHVEEVTAEPVVAQPVAVSASLQPTEATVSEPEVAGFVPITVQASIERNIASTTLDETQTDNTSTQQSAENLLLTIQEAFAAENEETELDLFDSEESDPEATDELLAVHGL